MSAAEPADPGSDGGNSSTGPATVILFRKGPSSRRKKRREDTVPNQREPKRSSESPHQRLADLAEARFLKHERTLTDPDTAEAYRIALGLVSNLFESARVKGVVNDEQHGELQAMIDGMKAAPGLL